MKAAAGLLLCAVSGSLAAQQSPGAPSDWFLSVTGGMTFGGPRESMGRHLTDEGWSDQGCSTKGTDCHANPVLTRPRLRFGGTLGRRVGRRLEATGVVEIADLGSAAGRKLNTDVRTSWTASTLGAALAFKPIPLVRLAAGPLVALLRADTPEGFPTEVVRAGFLLESGVRADVGGPFALDVSVAYRRIGRRTEGPWPTRQFASIGSGGPTPLTLDYSHLGVGLGFSAWF